VAHCVGGWSGCLSQWVDMGWCCDNGCIVGVGMGMGMVVVVDNMEGRVSMAGGGL
jgi:hypothetical protein